MTTPDPTRADGVAKAIEACDWSQPSIGNKAVLQEAVALLRATPPAAPGGSAVRTGAEMIARHRFSLADDGNCAEIDSNGLAEEIDAALAALASNATPSVEPVAWTIEGLAHWLHDETEHQESYPNHHWPEHPDDDGNRDGGFVKIVPKHAQAYFRQMAARCLGVRPFSGAYFKAIDATPSGLVHVPPIQKLDNGVEPFDDKWLGDGDSVHVVDGVLATPPAPNEPVPASGVDAWTDVLDERRRQVEAERWTPEHDDEYTNGELATAAVCYALSEEERRGLLDVGVTVQENYWPWDWTWWKPSDRRRDLVKAAALIIAEIERLDRAALSATDEKPAP